MLNLPQINTNQNNIYAPQAPALALVSPVVQKFIILHTIDIERDNLDLLSSYGKCISYDVSVEGHRNLEELTFDYLCIDLRNKTDRRYFDSQDTSQYNVICYISKIEQFDKLIDDLGCNNIITSFPKRQHYQGDYNKALLSGKTGKPSKCLSFINFATSFFSSLKK